jgi:cytoplasmic iron level regulating protein YaaA (DUF328/UPF0246 family)
LGEKSPGVPYLLNEERFTQPEFEKKSQDLKKEFQQKTDKLEKLELRAETLAESNKEIRELRQTKITGYGKDFEGGIQAKQ